MDDTRVVVDGNVTEDTRLLGFRLGPPATDDQRADVLKRALVSLLG